MIRRILRRALVALGLRAASPSSATRRREPVNVAELRRNLRCGACGGTPLVTGLCPEQRPGCIWTWESGIMGGPSGPPGHHIVDPWDEDEHTGDEDSPLLADIRARECEEAGCEGCAWCHRGVEYQEEE